MSAGERVQHIYHLYGGHGGEALGFAAVALAFGLAGIAAGLALFQAAIDRADGGDLEPGALFVPQADLPRQLVRGPMDRLAGGVGNEVLALARWDGWRIEADPFGDALLGLGEAGEVMGEYLGDPDRIVPWLKLDAGAECVVIPSRELGEADGGHGFGPLADLRLARIAALDLPLTGGD